MSSARAGFSSEYIYSISGILKICEIVFSILTFSIATGTSYGYIYDGMGWVIFNGVMGFLIALTFLLLYLFNIYPNFFMRFLIEPITNGTLAIFYLISGAVAASRANLYIGHSYGNCAAAASFFAFLCMVVFAVDAVLFYINNHSSSLRTTTTTTTTTNVPSEYASQNAVY